jgi:hypothetical protein
MTTKKLTLNKKEITNQSKKHANYIKRNIDAILQEQMEKELNTHALFMGSLLIGLVYETFGFLIDNTMQVALGKITPDEVAQIIGGNIKEHLNSIYNKAVVVH